MTDAKKPIPLKVRPSRRGMRLSETEKAEAITLWKSGAVTLDELAKKFHRDRTTFIRLFNGAEAVKGSDSEKHAKKVAEAVETALVGDVAQTAQRIKATKDEHYVMATLLVKESWKIIAKAKEEKRSIGTALPDLKAIHVEAQILKITREERYAVLGLNEESKHEADPIDDLVIKELTAEEIKQMNTASLGEDALDIDDLEGLAADIENIGDAEGGK